MKGLEEQRVRVKLFEIGKNFTETSQMLKQFMERIV
jgi:hypothetical protein